MMPNSPTIQPWFRSEKSTPYWPVKGPASRIAQLSPASVLCMILPLCPTIQPLFASAKSTPYRIPSRGEDWSDQVAPESVVFRIVPLALTIQPVEGLTKRTAFRLKLKLLPEPPTVCGYQVRPPSPV